MTDELAFEFTRYQDGELSGFDLGDITVVGQHGICTSSGKAPDQSMMIYLSIPHLLVGACKLADGGQSHFNFVGTDSSFSLQFTINGPNVEVRFGGQKIGRASKTDLLRAIVAGVDSFLEDPCNRLPPWDSAEDDLASAIRMANRTLDRSG